MTDAPIDFRILAGAGVPVREFTMSSSVRVTMPRSFVIQRGSVEIRLGNRVLETVSDYAIFGERR